jgi:hypothetical protein
MLRTAGGAAALRAKAAALSATCRQAAKAKAEAEEAAEKAKPRALLSITSVRRDRRHSALHSTRPPCGALPCSHGSAGGSAIHDIRAEEHVCRCRCALRGRTLRVQSGERKFAYGRCIRTLDDNDDEEQRTRRAKQVSSRRVARQRVRRWNLRRCLAAPRSARRTRPRPRTCGGARRRARARGSVRPHGLTPWPMCTRHCTRA